MLEKLLRRDKRPLVAVHRGFCGGAVTENTVYSALNAFRAGADIVEFDVERTLDNKAAVFHAGMEPFILSPCFPPVRLSLMSELKRRVYRSYSGGRLSRGVEELEEYLSKLKGKGILNFDRIWHADVGKCLKIVEKLGMFDQILFKSAVFRGKNKVLDALKEYPEAWFMPICKNFAAYETALKECAERGIDIKGFEIIFKRADDEFLSDGFIEKEHEAGRFLWVNSIHLNGRPDMCFDHGDNYALFGDADEHWGFLAEKGYDVIQTDWPDALVKYLDGRRA